MAGNEDTKELLSEFLNSGIYKFPKSKALLIDPVRILNRNYSQFGVSPFAYYSRFFPKFPQFQQDDEDEKSRVSTNTRKRKRKKKKRSQYYALNDKELIADRRHQAIRASLVKAHEELLEAKEILEVIHELNYVSDGWEPCVDLNCGGVEEISFVELGKAFQAPFYEIALDFAQAYKHVMENRDSSVPQHDDRTLLPIFNNVVFNNSSSDVVAEFLTNQYILPKESCFYMSDLRQIHSILPDNSDCGFNLIVIDPPWENRSAYQKCMYLTLPNRYFLSIPVGQLTHTKGALVGLWVTNREKLRNFVENELFPAWGVRFVATWYWLKVKHDGSLICDLDLFHHRPYECLLLGYSGREVADSELLSMGNSLKDKQVIISVPGDYSRKPPLADLLLDYVPGPRPARSIDLFAREVIAGWTSWGNEPLHFQDSRFFLKKI